MTFGFGGHQSAGKVMSKVLDIFELAGKQASIRGGHEGMEIQAQDAPDAGSGTKSEDPNPRQDQIFFQAQIGFRFSIRRFARFRFPTSSSQMVGTVTKS